jgi:hypothetical protein
VAATRTVADVLAVFGVWAGLTGGAQLVVVLRRRALLGKQWPLLLANGVSVIGGVAFVLAAVAPRIRSCGCRDLRGHRGDPVRHPGLAAGAAPSWSALPAGSRRVDGPDTRR